MLLSGEMLGSWVGSYMWTLIRITALITAAPVLGSRTIPVKVKLSIAIALTLVLVPVIPKAPAIDPLSGMALFVTLHQVLIGIAMGFALQLVFAMFVVGGQIIAYQMGLGFSQMVDPQSGMQVPVVSQFYIIVLTLVFFSFDGHLALVQVLADSFVSMPLGTSGLNSDSYWALIHWSAQMYSGAMQIALPAIASILLINLTFGVVTRSAPQFNIFSIGFPITIMMGFFVIMMTLSTVVSHINTYLESAFALMRALVS